MLYEVITELFTLCGDEFEREAFIDNLLTAISLNNSSGSNQKGNTNITIVLTLRADFYAHLAEYPELRA